MANDPTNYNCVCEDNYVSETLADMRTYLMIRLGFAAQLAYPPPGMADLLNSFLLEAQTLLYRKYEVLRLCRWFTWTMLQGVRFYDFAGNDDATPLSPPVISSVTTATNGGTVPAGTLYYVVTAINDNGETLGSAEVPVTSTGATSANTVNWTAVVTPPGVYPVTGYKIYQGPTGAELLLATVGLVTTYVDTGAITPAGALPSTNTSVLCTKNVDFRLVKWVGISQGDNVWRPLNNGIDPVRYATQIQSIPDSYETHQCIEVWPAPSDATWLLRVKGDFQLAPLIQDADISTIDPWALKLLAIANAKAHYGQPDAGNYAGQLASYVGDLTAGSHQTARYIPGRRIVFNAIPPKMAT